MLTGQTALYLFYVLAAASAILAIEAVYVSVSAGRRKSGTINRRLRRLAEDAPAVASLQALLRERGLSEKGDYSFGFIALNRLYTQSGVTGSPLAFFAMFLAAGLLLALVARLLIGLAPVAAFAIFLVVGFVLPLLILRRAKNRRIAAFARQLPDALDMIVRSLRAGHPTSVAIGLVARDARS